MKIGILQPGYLPWLGFFEQMYRSDIFVIYDDVQYDKNGWRNRNRIKTANGIQWLTVPVMFKFGEAQKVNEILIDNKSHWRKKHLLSIAHSYSKTPFFKEYIGLFQDTYSREWEYLIDLDLHFILKIREFLGLPDRPLIRSSSLNIEGDRMDRLVNICRHFHADVFYEGAAGAQYIDPGDFKRYGIDVVFQNYQHPLYKQLYGEFVPYLSIIDLLFNCGSKSLDVLLGRNNMEVS